MYSFATASLARVRAIATTLLTRSPRFIHATFCPMLLQATEILLALEKLTCQIVK